MSNNKRKRQAEEQQSHDIGHHKQKKRRKSDAKAETESDSVHIIQEDDAKIAVDSNVPSTNLAGQSFKTPEKKKKPSTNPKPAPKDNGVQQTLATEDKPRDATVQSKSKSKPTSATPDPKVYVTQAPRRPRPNRGDGARQPESEAHMEVSEINGTSSVAEISGEQDGGDEMMVDGVEEAVAEGQAAKIQHRRHRRKEEKRKLRELDHAQLEAKRAAKEQKRLEKGEKRDKKQKKSAPSWRLSEPSGGCMLDMDPLLSPKEDYMLIAYERSICVYSTSSSLLSRKLRVEEPEQISGFAFSPTDYRQLFVSRRSGVIEKWDWMNGTSLDMWNTKTPVHRIATLDPTSAERSSGLVYSVDRAKNDRWMITAHRLMAPGNAVKTDLGTLLKYEEPITSLRVFEEGNTIVATSGYTLIIGATDCPDRPILKEVSYVWREVRCSEWISSIDTRIRPMNLPSKKIKPSKPVSASAIDIVVGGLKGAMFTYEDLLGRLISKETISAPGVEDDITPRRLHWHRNAVASVKWSRDGNYVISGGQETVLIIWQLETGHKQELPHLSAAIESIVVSSTGASYGLRLADNSAMILSTTELQPTFSVAGIQLPSIPKVDDVELPFVPTVNALTEESLPKQNIHFPIVSSSRSNQLLLAVPADTHSAISSRQACFLQTLDLTSAQQVSRQALTRNKVTALNMGPEQNTIEEPSVTHMQLSNDGKWLATVDEWMPPRKDLDHLAYDGQRARVEQELRRECFLKFWAWSDDVNSWELVSRIDNPQPSPSGSAGLVSDLCAHPLATAFASIGKDGMIKMWKPQRRKRHGLDVRNKEGKSLTSWDCRWTSCTPTSKPAAAGTAKTMKLAFSSDGSVLAAASSITSAVHLLNADNGVLHSTRNAHFEGPLLGLGLLDRYIITVANELRVWDMVTEEVQYDYAFDRSTLDDKQRSGHTHLAVDQKHNIFAVATPIDLGPGSRGMSRGLSAGIALFDVERSEPLFHDLQPNLTTSLVPIAGKKGFYCIDSAAEVRSLTFAQRATGVSAPKPSGKENSAALGLGNIYGNGEADEKRERRDMLRLTSVNIRAERVVEDDSRVVSPEKLAEVFNAGSAFALPPVSDMFEKVAVLFAGSGGI